MITLGEWILCCLLAFGIGAAIGTQYGWSGACAYAKQLHREHRTGERLVQTPKRFNVDAVVYGSEWLTGKICEGR